LAETAEFVFDEFDAAPSPTESPSQISQGTTPISAESEETLTHERNAPDVDEGGSSTQSWMWFGVALTLLVAAFAAALAMILR
jgi:hypothetical protein